jgi:excisionase family DNA binding protein
MERKPAVLRVEDVAALLDISRSSAYEAVRRGQIPSLRVGRRIRDSRAALEDLLAGRTSAESTAKVQVGSTTPD